MRTLLLTVALALFACAQQSSVPDSGGASADGAGPTGSPSEVPENAIRVRDQYYMVPLAEPVLGCQAYRAFSPTLRVSQAIYYRAADGRFVIDRNDAVCD